MNVKILTFALLLFVLGSCNKSNYQDGGTLDPVFKGSTMDYLQSRPDMFDSLSKVIRLAGMEQTLKSEEVTFFAPPQQTIEKTIRIVNLLLKSYGKDTVYNLGQIKPAVWKKMLNRYIFKHKKSLTDYPQVDFLNVPVFPGQSYVSYGGDVMNVGVRYGDAGGVQYAGERSLYLSFIASLSSPTNSWINAAVATCNVTTNNGYIHVLRFSTNLNITINGSLIVLDFTDHYFGFDPLLFYNDALDYGIDP
jgi:hypothetical protein